jgi:hypothetical protein
MATQPQHDPAWHRAQAERLAAAAESPGTDGPAATLAVALANTHAVIAGLPRRAWRTRRQPSDTPHNLGDWPATD